MRRKKTLFFAVLIGIACFINGQNIYTYAGTGSLSTSGDGGPAVNADIYRPTAVYMDAAGNLFITSLDQRVRKVDVLGIINTTVCCSGGDGNPATSAGLSNPYGVTFDPLGNMYIADAGNNRIRKVNTSGIISTTVGTTSLCFFGGDGGAAASASLCSPFDVSFDAGGNMYIADAVINNRVRKVNSSGTITTIAGTGGIGYTGDGGPATAAELYNPFAIKADATGNIYITDAGHHCIRKIDPAGIITTIAGTGVAGHTGDGGPAPSAQLNAPRNLVLDAVGNIFITEQHYIRKINSSGIITTIAGTGVAGYSGDGGPAILAQFNLPMGLCLDASGNIYVADFNNNRVRVICMSSCPLGIKENYLNQGINIFPNPVNDKLVVQTEKNFTELNYILLDATGKEVSFISRKINEIDVSVLPEGLYFLQVRTEDGILTKKIVIQH